MSESRVKGATMSQTILVTGGSGMLGRTVVGHLQQHNYTVINADQQRGEGVYTIKADLLDAGQVYSAASKADAIVHLAAIPSPGGFTPHVVFQNNVMSTFNVLQAASDFGIRKVVVASSLSALGVAYKTHPIQLDYLPIDEAHPPLAQDAYGLSKIVDEEVARGFARLNPAMSIISLRLPLLANPGMIRRALKEGKHGHINAGELILWSYLDVRDAAEVIYQSLVYDQPGHEVLYVNAPDTYSETPTLDLIAQHFADAELDHERLAGHRSPIDCSRARELLGFSPRYDFRSVADDNA